MNRALLIIGNLLIFIGMSSGALAQTLQSNNYQIQESFIGPGGTVNSTSPNYSESSTVGDIGVGTSGSTNFQTQSGFNTTNDPRLVMAVGTSTVAFGSISTAAASSATATFSVLNYTSSGYAVYTVGNPPSKGAHTLCGMSAAGCTGSTSSPGTEQYGINLVGPNNVGASNFGANPAQVPTTNFAFGTASTNYNTTNAFRYVSGEQIAGASKTSGETDYTISYIINVSSSTPQGAYSGGQSIVVVGTY